MSVTELRYSGSLLKTNPNENGVLIIGQLKNISATGYDAVRAKLEPTVDHQTYNAAITQLQPSPTDSIPLYFNKATLSVLPTRCSRHNSTSRALSITRLVKQNCPSGDCFIVIICERQHVLASACAVARAFPLFSCKSNKLPGQRIVTVEFVIVGNDAHPLSDADTACLQDAGYGVRLAAKIVDAPCADMHTDTFVEEIKAVGAVLNITPLIIRGEELRERGFGGLYGVGKAATNPPALVVLSHKPAGATRSIAWVGKGIVFDTGGLCIKPKASMLTMKRDCGGAATVLAAFYLAVRQGFRDNLHAVFCLAENAVGPLACRPDDILTLYSGRTVEINNTDAEGRLVLGDGVTFAQRDLNCSIIVDVATLTGAQGIATGKYHAAVVSNDEQWEQACVTAGLASGDMCHPLPFSPELHFSEFTSAVADMKNSVADRNNAPSSCAGLFILSHLGFDFPGIWVHLDIASPVAMGERATGYGVALLNVLFGEASSCDLIHAIAPTGLASWAKVEDDGCNGNSENGSAQKKLKTDV